MIDPTRFQRQCENSIKVEESTDSKKFQVGKRDCDLTESCDGFQL